jgi:hypothetical protein
LAASFGFDLCGGGSVVVDTYLRRGTVLDVSRLFNERHQREIHSQLQHRGAGAVGAAGLDLLYDLCRLEEV